MQPHPLDPLTPEEINDAANVARASFSTDKVNFRVVTLKEPLKSQLLPFLIGDREKEPSPLRPHREARIQVIVQREIENQFFELTVDLDDGKVTNKQYLEGKHSFIDPAYMQAAEKACLADSKIREEIKTLELPPGAKVVVEAWAYATDGMNDMSDRTTMCWFYLRLADHADANYYAYPLDICAEVSEKLEVTKIYRLPSGASDEFHHEKRPFNHNRIHPTELSEYHPDLRPSPRATTKPLYVVQPEGPSFEVNGTQVAWEKWNFRIGFNYREGLTLHTVRYDNQDLFYRLSLAEMFVPYGDPRPPYPRKGAFDLGNDGAGINANNLRLGCDCLGTIKYFSFWHNTPDGTPLKLPNVVCCHEQDDGILWKHTNHRTGNPVVARSRILILQTIITVSNYEYIFAFHFHQDASITYEVRATGILSTSPINPDDTVPWGTTVAPGTLAAFHQHLFCLRIDPFLLSSTKSSLKISESHPLPHDQKLNPMGVGYHTTSAIVPSESGHDLDFSTARTFTIVNEDAIHPITKTPRGYQLLPHYSRLLLAHPTSFHAQRSEFGEHAVWVTRYQEDGEEEFPAGRWTMQSAGGEGIASAIRKRRGIQSEKGGVGADMTSVRNEDIVLWHTFGSTHNPRIEDWPVMPCETMRVGLRPLNFFEGGSPAIDVAVAKGEVGGKSVLYEETVHGSGRC